MTELSYHLVPGEQIKSDYDWINIDCNTTRVGKARCQCHGNTLIIYSINIFEEFEGLSYGRKTVEMFKKSFEVIIADRVRPSARGFWIKMGFFDNKDGNYIYRNKI